MLSINCNGCGEEFEMSMKYTIIFTFEEPQYNHYQTRCGHCGVKTVLFFNDPIMLTFGYPMVKLEEASYTIRHIWAQLNDPDNLPEEPATPDQLLDEWEIERFHQELESINYPEDM